MFALASVSLAGGLATGVATRRRWIDTSSHRWVHHAWYGLSLVTGVAAGLTDPRRRRGIVAGLLALGALPRVRPGARAHTALALVAAGCYAGVARGE